MSHIQSGARVTKRRKEALIRREKNLRDWKGTAFGGTDSLSEPSNEGLKAKIACAETDIENLKKKLGAYA